SVRGNLDFVAFIAEYGSQPSGDGAFVVCDQDPVMRHVCIKGRGVRRMVRSWNRVAEGPAPISRRPSRDVLPPGSIAWPVAPMAAEGDVQNAMLARWE